MPMSAATLKAAIKSEITSAFPEHVIDEQLDKLCGAIATAVVAEVKKMTIVATATCSTGGGPVTVTGIT